jgi:hypothetical protein
MQPGAQCNSRRAKIERVTARVGSAADDVNERIAVVSAGTIARRAVGRSLKAPIVDSGGCHVPGPSIH